MPKYEIKTTYNLADVWIADYLNNGWEIIWQEHAIIDCQPMEIIRFKRQMDDVASTERLTSEASKQRGDTPHVSCACGWRKDYFTVRELDENAQADIAEHDKVCPDRERFEAEFARLKEVLNA